MAKEKTRFVCQQCGYTTSKWLGRCPDCDSWSSFVEELEPTAEPHSKGGERLSEPQQLTKVTLAKEQRRLVGIEELDRVLGGGLVEGSLILVGGEPGIGKSTLMLQVALLLGQSRTSVLYWSGEESQQQIKMRANRLGAVPDTVYIQSETCLDQLQEIVLRLKPSCMVIDSIQTVYRSDLTSAPGTVSQVRDITAQLMRMAKTTGMVIFIVGHVTKEGAIAGPKMLEHMVDTVLYFEGDHHQNFRIVRAVKNRFGSTNEIGVFEMTENGLIEVKNPSAIFLAERPLHGPGSAVTALLEGSRPLLAEVQALVSNTNYQNPRRLANGFDHNRMAMLIAILEKRLGLQMGMLDAYINVAGGLRISEPAADLAVILALASSFRERPLDASVVAIGEVGLTGELRSVTRLEQRLREAARLGFERALIPAGGKPVRLEGIQLMPVRNIQEAIAAGLKGAVD
ncbi:MAG: DNA repair protein RadA [Negativicutes bacterium]|nr:DNA repair protein RadA [Negativicutes bacterium]